MNGYGDKASNDLPATAMGWRESSRKLRGNGRGPGDEANHVVWKRLRARGKATERTSSQKKVLRKEKPI